MQIAYNHHHVWGLNHLHNNSNCKWQYLTEKKAISKLLWLFRDSWHRQLCCNTILLNGNHLGLFMGKHLKFQCYLQWFLFSSIKYLRSATTAGGTLVCMLGNQVADSLAAGPITALATQMNWEKLTGVTNVTSVFINKFPHVVYSVKTTLLLCSFHHD